MRPLVLTLTLAACVLGCRQAPAPAEAFDDVAAEVGLDFVHDNGMTGQLWFVEMMGAGAALLDHDGDGDLDAWLGQGHLLGDDARTEDRTFAATGPQPPRDRLYRNDLIVHDDGRRELKFVDVTEESGLHGTGYAMGAAVGDVDGDGDPDLFVTAFGANRLWRNDGDGTFTDVTAAAGVGDPRWSVSAAFFDADVDGDLDLFVVNYVDYRLAAHRTCRSLAGHPDYCAPYVYEAVADRLYENRGDGTFVDVTVRAGLADVRASGLGVATGDFDGDGRLDLYVANDGMANHLWLNRGGWRFENAAVAAGAALNERGEPEAGMGVDSGDVDGDGDEDLFVTHLVGETNTLYVNDGAGRFADRTATGGLALPSRPRTGFGTVLADVDLDGDLDLVAINGAVKRVEELARAGHPHPLGEADQLFVNLGDGRFRDDSERAGAAFALREPGRGAAVGDINLDGDPDLLVTVNAGRARVLLNRAGDGRRWLRVRLREAGSPPVDALGAWALLERADGRRLGRRVRTDGSYASARDPRLLFGLGDDDSTGPLWVRWTDGAWERFDDLSPDREHELVRGGGRPAEGPPT